MRILIVEDNPRIAESLAQSAKESGYTTTICRSVFEGEDEACGDEYDAIVLELILPDGSGVDLCRSLRARDVATPILIVSSLTTTKEKVACLDAGADDYMVRPLDSEEFLARLRALMRRASASQSTLLEVADLTLDLHQRHAVRQDRAIRLSSKEYALLEFLMRNPNRVLERRLILDKVWDTKNEPSSNLVDVYVSSLRRKIDRPFPEPLLHTVVGAGYRFGSPGVS